MSGLAIVLLFFLVVGLLFGSLGLVSMTVNSSATLGSVSGNSSTIVTGGNTVLACPTVPVAQAGTLTTRASGTVGTLTLGAGHGIITGQRVDLYWAGGRCYGAIVGTVAGTSVPIASVAGGDALPPATTAIVVGVCTQEVLGAAFANVVGILCTSPVDYYVIFETSVPADHLVVKGLAGKAYQWQNGSGVTSPLTANIATVWISHSDVVNAHGDINAAVLVA